MILCMEKCRALTKNMTDRCRLVFAYVIFLILKFEKPFWLWGNVGGVAWPHVVICGVVTSLALQVRTATCIPAGSHFYGSSDDHMIFCFIDNVK